MAGVVLSPATPVQNIKYILSLINMVLIMTVNPGEKNQVFLFDMIDKIKEASELLKDKNIDIEVDGSIDDKTAVLCQAAGANVFVSGGYIFNNNNIEQQIVKLQQALKIKIKYRGIFMIMEIEDIIKEISNVTNMVTDEQLKLFIKK